MVEKHAAVGLVTRTRDDDVALTLEGESLIEGGIRGGLQCFEQTGDQRIVVGEQSVFGGHAKDLAGIVGSAHVDLGAGDKEVGEAGELCGVASQAGEGHGPGMGGEVVVAVGDVGQDAACGFKLVFGFGVEAFG